MRILEWVVIRLILFVILPLALVILVVGPARFWRKVRRAWSWVWGGAMEPEQILASVVKQQQEHIDALRTALVRADGSIASGAHAGSIHKVGAALQNAPSCNGWTFWHVEQGGVFQPLDALRQQYLASLA